MSTIKITDNHYEVGDTVTCLDATGQFDGIVAKVSGDSIAVFTATGQRDIRKDDILAAARKERHLLDSAVNQSQASPVDMSIGRGLVAAQFQMNREDGDRRDTQIAQMGDFMLRMGEQMGQLSQAINILAGKSTGSEDMQTALIAALTESRKPIDMNLKLELPQHMPRQFVAERMSDGKLVMKEVIAASPLIGHRKGDA